MSRVMESKFIMYHIHDSFMIMSDFTMCRTQKRKEDSTICRHTGSCKTVKLEIIFKLKIIEIQV